MRSILSLLLIFPMACKAEPGFSGSGTAPAGPQHTTVLCIGDSLTNFGTSAVISWCDQSRFATTNIGRAGTQTAEWVTNYVSWTSGVTVGNFDIVVVALGYNDANEDASALSAAQFAIDMTALVVLLEADGAVDIMLVGPPHRVHDDIDRTAETNAAVDAYVLELQTLAAARASSRHSLALSVNELGYPALYHNQNHPSTAGQAVWKNWFDGAIYPY